MRRSLAASGALLVASICAGLGVHTTHIFTMVLGAPARAALWPLVALGLGAVAALAWMIHTTLRRDPVSMRLRTLAPRAFAMTAVLTGSALPWYVAISGAPFDVLAVVFGALAAAGYCLLVSVALPVIRFA